MLRSASCGLNVLHFEHFIYVWYWLSPHPLQVHSENASRFAGPFTSFCCRRGPCGPQLQGQGKALHTSDYSILATCLESMCNVMRVRAHLGLLLHRQSGCSGCPCSPVSLYQAFVKYAAQTFMCWLDNIVQEIQAMYAIERGCSADDGCTHPSREQIPLQMCGTKGI